VCNPNTCVPPNCQLGATVDILDCLVRQLRALVRSAPRSELAPRLTKPGSRLRLTLARASREVRSLKRALNRQGPPARVSVKIRRIRRALDQFAAKVEKARDRSLVSPTFSSSLMGIAAEAVVQTTRVP
jgi:hypothetical protein